MWICKACIYYPPSCRPCWKPCRMEDENVDEKDIFSINTNNVANHTDGG